MAEGAPSRTFDPHLHLISPFTIEAVPVISFEAPAVKILEKFKEVHELRVFVDAIKHYLTRDEYGTDGYGDARATLDCFRDCSIALGGITTLEYRMAFLEAQSQIRDEDVGPALPSPDGQ